MFDVLGRIKSLREARGWSVYKLAQISEIPQSTIATWYQKSLCPPIDKLEMICNSFGMTLSEFFSLDHSFLLTEAQGHLIEKWDLLNEKEKAAVFAIIEAFNSSRNM